MKWYAQLIKGKTICLFLGHNYYWRPMSVGHVCKRCSKLKQTIQWKSQRHG